MIKCLYFRKNYAKFVTVILVFFAIVQKFRLLDYVTLLHATVEVMILKGLTSIFLFVIILIAGGVLI